jgi:hypothetical protein
MKKTADHSKPTTPSKTNWHHLLGSVFEQVLTPVGVSVYTDLPVMGDLPEADIVLLRRDTPTWTKAQLARLADGLRHTNATDILIEFKYSESINEDAFLQILCYDTFYKRAKLLKTSTLQSFLVSSQTPRADTLTEWGYVETEYKGVYRSQEKMLSRIILILLNPLADEPHNAFLKCFASRPAEKRKAFTTLGRSWADLLTDNLGNLFGGLQKLWHSLIGEILMKSPKQAPTPEEVMEMGRNWLKSQVARLPLEERLKGLKPEERLKGLKPEERLKGLKPEERLKGLKPEERLKGLKPEEIFSLYTPKERLMGLKQGLKPEEVFSLYAPQERVKGLKPEEILDQLDPAQIEEYLRQAKRKKARSKKT